MEYFDEIQLSITDEFLLDPKLMPISKSYLASYDKITKIISKKHFRRGELGFLMLCGTIAMFASYYNFVFGKSYAHNISERWKFSEAGTEVFSTFCGLMSFIMNTAINARSLNQAYEVIKKELLKQRKRMPDEKIIRLSVGILALFSLIGAIPFLKFVYDATEDENKIYIAFMEIMQFIVAFASNFRGIYNNTAKKLPTQKQQDVENFKLELLTAFNDCLIENHLNKDDLINLSQKKLVNEKAPWLRKGLKFFFATYVGGYSAAFFTAVNMSAPVVKTNSFFDDIFNYGVKTVAIISSGLRWFLLSNAYMDTITRFFNLAQKPILKVNQKEVRSRYISRNTERVLAISGLLCAIFSLGSASKIFENYFLGNQEKSVETFWLSLLIGGGAALGINTGDISILMEKLIDFGAHIFKTYIKPSSDKLDYLGSSHDEMIMRAMLEIAEMEDLTFLEKFTVETHSNQKEPDPANGIRSRTHSKYGHEPNQDYEDLLEACEYMKTNVNDLAFNHYKKYRSQDELDARLQEYVESSPLIQAY